MKSRQPLGRWGPWMVLLVCSAATLAGTMYVRRSVDQRDQLRFLAATHNLHLALRARIDTYVALLRAADALFAASTTVTGQEFQAFVEHLALPTRFPGVQGIGFATVATAEGVPALEAAMRRQGVDTFHVWPAGPPRPLYAPIMLLAPVDERNRGTLGFDMFTDPTSRAAMEEARDTGGAVSTGKVTLKQESGPARAQIGFLIYVPVYGHGAEPTNTADRAKELDGFVYALFRTGDVLTALLGRDEERMLAVRIRDAESPSPGDLFYDSAPGQDFGAARFYARSRLEFAQRFWMVEVAAQPSFFGTAPIVAPLLFVGGILIALLLFAVTRADARARAAAEAAAEALRHSEEELRVASRAKDEFLATLSHELRTPLNAILGWASLLRTGSLKEGRREDALAVIERNARAQARLIEDLLDVSRIITGKLRLDLRMIPLNPVLEEAINTVRPAADAKGVSLWWTPDPSAGAILAAPDRLQQIVWNLLLNAIKFTPAGGRIDLVARRTSTAVRIVVRDTGMGITPGFLPHVFERFRQADSSTTRTHSGVGLGLAIVRHLVELHGGTIQAASEGEGRGAAFTITLPVKPAPLHPPPADPAAAAAAPKGVTRRSDAPLDGVRVLVVDDQRDGLEMIEHALMHEGAVVQTATSVELAAAALDRQPFDIVVTDVAMPEADGFALMRRVQNGSPAVRELPVIAVTAYAGPADRERVAAGGFQGFLTKPIELDVLIAMVARLAQRAVH